MGRASVKEDKCIYQTTREAMCDEKGKPWSREKAAAQIAEIENGRYYYLNEYRIQKIEDDPDKIQPDEVVALSKVYNKPELRNHYCCHQCPIGKIDTPNVIYKDNIHEILVHLAVSLESINDKKQHLMKILSDGKIDSPEAAEFQKILEELEQVSMTIEAIQLWTEKNEAFGNAQK